MKRKNSFTFTEASFDNLMEKTEGEYLRQINCDESTSHNSSPMKRISGQSRTESDRDSDYGGSDVERKSEVTTLRMLFEKCQQSDLDFYDCCLDVGLLNQTNSKCYTCDIESDLVEKINSKDLLNISLTKETDESTSSKDLIDDVNVNSCTKHSSVYIDSLFRKCPTCYNEWSIRRDSWCQNIPVTLKELVLVIYCWTRNYSELLTSHELDISINKISDIFTKCSSVADDYFKNTISNIGGKDKIIVTNIFTYNDRTILGFIEKDTKNVYYTILKQNYDESEILTLVVDNLSSGSILQTQQDSKFNLLFDDECLSYLKETWEITFSNDTIKTDSLILQWSYFERKLPSNNSLNPESFSVDSDKILRLELLKYKLDNSKDSFLSFIEILTSLYGTNVL